MNIFQDKIEIINKKKKHQGNDREKNQGKFHNLILKK